MTEYDHLPLVQTGEPVARRKRPAPIPTPNRNYKRHAKKLTEDVDALVEKFRSSEAPDSVDPGLVCKVSVDGGIADEEWEKINLRLLMHADQHSVILFSDDSQLNGFRERLNAYQAEKPEGQKGQSHEGFINRITKIAPLEPNDRIGPGLIAQGIASQMAFEREVEYLLDAEIWRPDDDHVDVFLNRVLDVFEAAGGEELSRYTPLGGILLRLRGSGQAFQALLERVELSRLDVPPQPDMEDGGEPEETIDELGPIHPVPVDAVCIGVIDSGVNDGHPLLAGVVRGAIGVGDQPAGDDKGHGTAVAAVAAYGDLDEMRRRNEFTPRFAIASARVVDANGRFPDMSLAPKLVEDAIHKLHAEYGCRIFNLSLADKHQLVSGRAGFWSAVLDSLCKSLDIVIVVTTGNSNAAALDEAHGNRITKVYPSYLVEDANRLFEPGGAVNTITVGSIAHVNGLSADQEQDVTKQIFAEANEPSPFTRSGPGIGSALKPDLVDYGGNAIYDGTAQSTRNGAQHPPAGILSLNHQYTKRLFATFSGTSLAAPLVAYKAGLLLERFPNASANLIRALLAVGAEYPEASLNRLAPEHDSIRHAVLGYGHANVTSSLSSDDERVILTHSSALLLDKFAVFAIPIPEVFQTTAGYREIRVALSFDPLVRRSRRDYAGVRMSFDLIRGASAEEVFEAYRSLDKDEDTPEKLQDRQKCTFSPGIRLRETSTLQCATFAMKQNPSDYGDVYYLVVRCLDRWANDLVEAQPFSVAVQIRHEAEIQLYEQLRVRLNA